MSLKKDRTNSFDNKFMRFAINLATNQRGLTGTNPSVGCVLVKNNQIISTGITSINGRPHAEYNAVKNSVDNVSGSTAYVTMEPCTHKGKTDPCSSLLIKSKIKLEIKNINTKEAEKIISEFNKPNTEKTDSQKTKSLDKNKVKLNGSINWNK